MKIVTLSPTQFDRLAQQHTYNNFYQSSAYGNLMKKHGYEVHYLGIVSDTNKLIGGSLILYRNVFMNNKIAYAPRGFLCNYERINDLEDMIKMVKKVLGKQGFMLLRIDPYIALTARDNKGIIMNNNSAAERIISNLKKVGFTYKGKNKFFETEKPRWESLIVLENDQRKMFERFDKHTRNKIRRAINFGIEVEVDEEKNIDKLCEFIKDKDKKGKKYYMDFLNAYKDDIDIYYAKVNTENYTINSRQAYENELANNSDLAMMIQDPTMEPKQKTQILNKKMESDKLLDNYKTALIQATELLKKNPKGIIIGGAMVLRHNGAAFLITEGVNKKYQNQNSDYVIKWKMVDDYIKQGLKYINLGAIAGEFEKQHPYQNLNEKKLGFNSTVTEYIGEFDIVLNNFSYNLYNSFVKNKK